MPDLSDFNLDDERLTVALKALRVVAGLTQAQVADRSSIHQTTVSRIEAGSKFPTLEEIQGYLPAVGATYDELDLMLFLVRRLRSPGTRSGLRVMVEETGEPVDKDEFAELVGRALGRALQGGFAEDSPSDAPVRRAPKAKAS